LASANDAASWTSRLRSAWQAGHGATFVFEDEYVRSLHREHSKIGMAQPLSPGHATARR
jgi:hypothetical protein